MRDMSIEQTAGLEQLSPQQAQAWPDADALARIQVEARRLQGATLGRLIARLFGRGAEGRPAHEDATEHASLRCHKRDAGMLRRIGGAAARALSGRAANGPMSEHLLKDVGLSRKDIDGFHVSAARAYNRDAGSTAA